VAVRKRKQPDSAAQLFQHNSAPQSTTAEIITNTYQMSSSQKATAPRKTPKKEKAAANAQTNKK
jgi:hypothetical protein